MTSIEWNYGTNYTFIILHYTAAKARGMSGLVRALLACFVVELEATAVEEVEFEEVETANDGGVVFLLPGALYSLLRQWECHRSCTLPLLT